MSDQGNGDDQVAQRMDALLLKLLKTPPKSRAELTEQMRRLKGKSTKAHAKRPTVRKKRRPA